MNSESTDRSEAAVPLAPEDIRAGDYVAMLHEVSEYFPIFCIDESWRKSGLLRLRELPESVTPMRVVRVCLPYVLVQHADRKPRTLDVRRHLLARVSAPFGREAFRRYRKKKKKKGGKLTRTN